MCVYGILNLPLIFTSVINQVDAQNLRDITQQNAGRTHVFGHSQHHETKLRGLSPHANYTDRAAAAGRRS